jgi:hypothetical protein
MTRMIPVRRAVLAVLPSVALGVAVWALFPWAMSLPRWLAVALSVAVGAMGVAAHFNPMWGLARADEVAARPGRLSRMSVAIWSGAIVVAILLPGREGAWSAGSVLLWGLVGDPSGPGEPWVSTLGGAGLVTAYAGGIASVARGCAVVWRRTD